MLRKNQDNHSKAVFLSIAWLIIFLLCLSLILCPEMQCQVQYKKRPELAHVTLCNLNLRYHHGSGVRGLHLHFEFVVISKIRVE